jgi:hypothetical protein
MATDEYHEAVLLRVQEIEHEIAGMAQREAVDYAYHVSRDMPEEALRMLVAELLMEYWSRSRASSVGQV